MRNALITMILVSGCMSAGADPSALSKEEVAEEFQTGKADFSVDWCERRGWYDDGSCDWFCISRDPDCDAPELFSLNDPTPTRFPIVLAHGFDASPGNRWGFFEVEETLSQDGHEVYSAEVAPYLPVPDRAGQLAMVVDQVLTETGAERVNLIAHSMGGLDARYLVNALGYGDRVASITTISSPHRGSSVADFALNALPESRRANAAIDFLAAAWGRTYSEVSDEASIREALYSISTEGARELNDDFPEDPATYFQSWAGVSTRFGRYHPSDYDSCEGQVFVTEGFADHLDLTLYPMSLFHDGPNDGMSTVESAKWGHFRGCIPADHLDQVGAGSRTGVNRNTGFDHREFYRSVAADLAGQGF